MRRRRRRLRYQIENATLAEQIDDLTQQMRTTEDELAAARTSLRRMIREQTTALDH